MINAEQCSTSYVSTLSRPKAAANRGILLRKPVAVSTLSRPKAAAKVTKCAVNCADVSTLSRPKAAAEWVGQRQIGRMVSTLSRPKAAAAGFDPARVPRFVSTLSRPKAAANKWLYILYLLTRFNTQPPEGGCAPLRSCRYRPPRFNTQPPEGGCCGRCTKSTVWVEFQHSAARRRLQLLLGKVKTADLFQHSAARRRLRHDAQPVRVLLLVSTLSRPKAAA